MGGKSSQSTRSANTTNTTNETQSINSAISGNLDTGATALSGETNNLLEDGGVIWDGSENVVNITDGGAFELVGSVVDGVGQIITNLQENQASVLNSATVLASDALAVTGADTGLSDKNISNLIKAGAVISLAVAVAYIGRKGFK